MRVASNDKDDRPGLRGFVQFNKYTHTHERSTQETRTLCVFKGMVLSAVKKGKQANTTPPLPYSSNKTDTKNGY